MTKEYRIYDQQPSVNGGIRRDAVRGVILLDHNNIVLERYTKHNFFSLPGGGIKKGEDATEAFKREVIEETGLFCNIL